MPRIYDRDIQFLQHFYISYYKATRLVDKILIVRETFKMVHRCMNDEAPSYFACLFDRLAATSSRELRSTETDFIFNT